MPQSVSIIETTIVTRQGVLSALNVEIYEREAYKRDQEKIISGIVEEGNARLLELNYAIKLARLELKTLKSDIQAAAQDRKLVKADLVQLQREAEALYNGSLSYTSA